MVSMRAETPALRIAVSRLLPPLGLLRNHCRSASRYVRLAVSVMLLAATPSLGGAQSAPAEDESPHSDVTLISAVKRAVPGTTVTVGIRITLDDGWHTYWVNGGDAGLPLGVAWTLPAGVSAGAVRLPTPRLLAQPPLMSYGYHHEMVALVDLTIDANVASATPLEIVANADWLACADVCLPAAGRATLSLPMGIAGAEPGVSGDAALIERVRAQLPIERSSLRASVFVRPSTLLLAVWDSALEQSDNVRLRSPLLDRSFAPYVFPDSTGIIKHADAQRVARLGDTLWISMPRSAYGTPPVDSFGALLTSDPTTHEAPAWHVTASVLIDTLANTAGITSTQRAQRVRGEQVLGDSLSAVTTGGLAVAAMADAAEQARRAPTAAQSAGAIGLRGAVLFALLGGLLLNLMPCVFPVLSLKVLSFVERGAGDASVARKHALVFAAGVVATFWALALVLLALRAGGASVGWGFQLQSPMVVALLSLLLFALGLNLAGVFEVGMAFTRLGAVGQGEGYRDSFLTGALAVVVATPCTAPFMGAALGYALVQPPVVGMAVFTSLALGLALPYVVLAWSPPLMRRLPRPGPWLETFKQALAFPLFATVVWLLWVFGQQTSMNAIALMLLMLTLLAFGGWMLGRAQSRLGKAVSGAIVFLSVAVTVLVSGNAIDTGSAVARTGAATATAALTGVSADTFTETPAETGVWQDFSADRLATARATGRPVLVDFTAAWCLSCQVNERVALRTESVQRAFAVRNVVLLRADWTSRNAEIASVIASYGRSGIPLYVLYPADPGKPPELLPTVLTSGIVVDAIERAAGGAS